MQCYHALVVRHVIYIPGLGDRQKFGQNIIIQSWRLLGLRPHYFALQWYEQEGFDKKLERILDKARKLSRNNKSVSIVGVSAGASAALNAFATSNNIDAVIIICGKVNNPGTIGKKTFDLNPDFEQSVYDVERSMKLLDKERSRILSIHPWADQTVPIKDTVIEGAKEKTFPGWSHISGIFFAVILGGPTFYKFIKQSEKKL